MAQMSAMKMIVDLFVEVPFTIPGSHSVIPAQRHSIRRFP